MGCRQGYRIIKIVCRFEIDCANDHTIRSHWDWDPGWARRKDPFVTISSKDKHAVCCLEARLHAFPLAGAAHGPIGSKIARLEPGARNYPVGQPKGLMRSNGQHPL